MRFLYFFLILFLANTVSLKAQENKQVKDSIYMLTYKRVLSKNYEGWKISYTEFKDNLDDFIIPFTFSFDSYKIKSNVLHCKKIKSLDTYAFGVGFDGYQKLFNGVYLILGTSIPLGLEVIKNLETKKNNHFLIGIEPKLGLKFLTSKELGLVIGGSAFWRLSNSKALNNEIGFEIELGINF